MRFAHTTGMGSDPFDPLNPDSIIYDPSLFGSGGGGDNSNIDPADVIRTGAAPTNAAELATLLAHSRGSITVDRGSLALMVANNHSWQFSVEQLSNGQFKITPTNYQNYGIYGGAGLLVLVLLFSSMRGR